MGSGRGSGSTAGVCDSGVNGGVKAGLMRFGGGGEPALLWGDDDGSREYSGIREESDLGA